MTILHNSLVCLVIALVAFLYSAVGQGGSTGYIAVMTLFGFGATVVKPTALFLGILVASIGAFQFWRAGHFSWTLFWRFALLSVPSAYLGGYLRVPSQLFRLLLGVILLFSAAWLLWRHPEPAKVTLPKAPIALIAGAVIGLFAGLTGTGGGYFLTPLLLFCAWARTRNAAAASVFFILVNSIAGLFGYLYSGQPLPSMAILLAGAAIAGGSLGSHYGSRRLPARGIHWLLAIVLILAAANLILAR
jgi:uncharacterized protein